MTALTKTVRVLPDRALILRNGTNAEESTILHRAGEELELDRDCAQDLIAQGYVEPADARRRPIRQPPRAD
jgi:hypothetical protein